MSIESISTQGGNDSSENLTVAIQQFRTIKATLDRLVVNQDDKITEIYDRKVLEHYLVKDIPLNLKLKLEQMLSPLNFFISYPQAAASKRVHFFLSHSNKEPSLGNHEWKYLNPTTVKVDGTIKDLKLGCHVFEYEWIYLTVISETDQRIKINPRFKQNIYTNKAKKDEGLDKMLDTANTD